MTISQVEVLPGSRQSNLGIILGSIMVLEVLGHVLSFLVGPRYFSGLAARLHTQRSILLSLVIYAVVAVWGFFLNSVAVLSLILIFILGGLLLTRVNVQEGQRVAQEEDALFLSEGSPS